MKKFTIIIWIASLLVSCDDSTKKVPEDNALQFAEAYYNYDFKRAEKLCTEEGRRCLVFKASNTTQADLDMYNSNESVTAEISGVTQLNDSLISVRIETSNGENCRVEMISCDSRWLVRAISF